MFKHVFQMILGLGWWLSLVASVLHASHVSAAMICFIFMKNTVKFIAQSKT